MEKKEKKKSERQKIKTKLDKNTQTIKERQSNKRKTRNDAK